jgi:hypothetical protein
MVGDINTRESRPKLFSFPTNRELSWRRKNIDIRFRYFGELPFGSLSRSFYRHG